jgi:hypothetical protein
MDSQSPAVTASSSQEEQGLARTEGIGHIELRAPTLLAQNPWEKACVLTLGTSTTLYM